MSTCVHCGERPDGGDKNYPGLCAACAWRAWFAPMGEHWNRVECVECELGRDCDKHPAPPLGETEEGMT